MTSAEPISKSQNESSGLGDLLPVLVRRRWYFLAPLFTLGLVAYAVANLLPLQYRSSAFIIVEQRKVPDQIVAPNVLMNLQKRLDSMTQEILSRTRLQRFIEDLGLYPNQRKSMSMDDIVDMMRSRTSVELEKPVGRQLDVTGFRVFFSDPNPQVAQRVTNELASLFIDQDSRERSAQSKQTTSFLENQVEAARKELDSQEAKVGEYKLRHLGELPAQQESNLRILSSLETQLQANTAKLDRAEQQRIYLESLRSQHEALKTTPTGTATDAKPPSLVQAQETLASLWRQLNELSAKYTEAHPEVVSLRKQIVEWENTVQRLKTEPIAGGEIDSRLKATLAEIESSRREEDDVRRRISRVQSQLSQMPVREQEMADLMRQYENSKANFQSLLQKKMGSELASNLEERQGGEQFRLLDAAILPDAPVNRMKIFGGGWLLAAAFGLALIIVREAMDRTVHKRTDLDVQVTRPFKWKGPDPQVMILARIPVLRSEREDKRIRLRLKFEIAAIVAMTLICPASALHTFLRK